MGRFGFFASRRLDGGVFDGGAAPGSNDSVGRWVFSNKILRKSLILSGGAGNENRTRIASLEGWSFTIKLCPQEPNGKKKGAMKLPDRKPFFAERYGP